MNDEQPATRITKILVVDDETSIRSLLSRILEKDGYQCTTVSDVKEARTSMKETHFDLLLSDIKMPGESGLDLLQSTKTDYPDMAVVMVTVIDDQETAKAALEMGIYGYIIKPFDKAQILISVANALRRRELEMQAKTYRQDLEQTIKQRTAELLNRNAALRNREAELKAQTKELGEVNSALKVLLKKREEDKTAIEDNILTNVKKIVEPYLQKLQKSKLNHEQQVYLSIIAENIHGIISPFIKELSSSLLSLSPTEIQVADLIKQGKTTKEIAAILNLSANTVMSHRYNIRRKLGMLQKKTNLYTFLQSIK